MTDDVQIPVNVSVGDGLIPTGGTACCTDDSCSCAGPQKPTPPNDLTSTQVEQLKNMMHDDAEDISDDQVALLKNVFNV